MEEAAPTTTTTTQENGAAQAPDEPGREEYQPNPLMWVMFLILGVYIFLFMFRGPRKKQQEHQKMVSSLRKNDRVRTIGGIYGTVLDVRDDEIVLKVDEGSNTKIRVIPSAIATVLSSSKTE
ncbi:MAG TPA: preprotein translocase subunit YajC [Phycisphaerales bacterium]|nr:preprotein translocase subunit YajC [Phycisphaerales bacterium]